MQAVADRSAMVREWGVFLEEWPLVLSPFFMRPMYDYDHDETFDGARDLFDAMMYSYSINYMGFPAGNIPIGLVGGRPCGVQIIGRRFREDMILDAMQVVEDQVGILAHQLWERGLAL